MTPSRLPKAPAHLSPTSRRWWLAIVKDYDLAEHQLRVLTAACESWDRKEQARERVAVEGLTFATKYGELRPHPAVAIERDARLAFLRSVRELALVDVGEPSEPRPPRLHGYEGRH